MTMLTAHVKRNAHTATLATCACGVISDYTRAKSFRACEHTLSFGWGGVARALFVSGLSYSSCENATPFLGG